MVSFMTLIVLLLFGLGERGEVWTVAALGLFGLFASNEDACVASVRLPVFVAVWVAATVLALWMVVALAPRNVVEGGPFPFVAEIEFNLFHLKTPYSFFIVFAKLFNRHWVLLLLVIMVQAGLICV